MKMHAVSAHTARRAAGGGREVVAMSSHRGVLMIVQAYVWPAMGSAQRFSRE
jgi:hypothetical protein